MEKAKVYTHYLMQSSQHSIPIYLYYYFLAKKFVHMF